MFSKSNNGTSAMPSNKFFAALSPKEQNQLLPALEPVEIEHSLVLHQPYDRYEYIYFPENSIISLVSTFEDGASIEAGIAGREGFAGIAAVLSDGFSPRETVVQLPGRAFRIKAATFRRMFEENPGLREKTLGFVYAFYTQVSQNGACNKHHHVDRRFAKWLLMVHDRIEGDELHLTHEFIAQMLGIQRPTVTLAASNLKDEGLIEYNRGKIKIFNRPGLEAKACECYRTVREIYDQYQMI